MDKPFNLNVIETKQKLIEVLNTSNLPISVSAMIISELSQLINSQANQQILKEKQEYKENEKEENAI